MNVDLVWNQDASNFIVAARTYLHRFLDRIEELEREAEPLRQSGQRSLSPKHGG